jgi:DNA-binding NtrC family response regulator
LVLGREPGPGGLTLDDPQASRQHAFVEPEGDGRTIRDNRSRNGLFVDGARHESAALRHGTVVRIGGTILVVIDVEIPSDARLEPETPGLRGQSYAMQELRGNIATVAPHSVSVLILGETGVGKERVAQEIHAQSGRRGPFVPVNCAAIPDNLAESELFGHVAGAFTGAAGRAPGLFVAAAGGTLFLDEIGELPLALQPKLLRALATGEVRPVGAAEAHSVDVRVLAATHRDLAAATQRGDFREDLLARLSSWTLRVPPLRERREDIHRLAQVFLERHPGAPALSVRAAEALLVHDWRYNVRQLEHVVAAALVQAAGEPIVRRGHLPGELAQGVDADADPASTARLEVAVARDELPSAAELGLVIERFDGNVAEVARFFGKDRQQVYRWLRRYGIDPTRYRDGS